MLVRPRAVPPIAPFLGPSRETWLPWEEIGRGPLRDGPATAAIQLDLFAGGTFARTTEASYHTGAPNAGTGAFLAWAAPGVRRVDDRGDGLGPMLLMEGSRANGFQNSEQFDATSWLKSLVTITPDVATAPDGAMSADLFDSSNNQARAVDSLAVGVIPDNVPISVSCYVKSLPGAGAQPFAFRVQDRAGTLHTLPVSLTETWGRKSAFLAAATGATAVSAGPSNDFATQVDAHVWGAQIEQNAFWPSSYIRTTATELTRSLETLVYGAGTYPAEFISNGFRVTVAPDFSSADLLAVPASTYSGYVVGVGTSTPGLRFRRDSGVNQSIGFLGSAGSLSILNATWSRGQALTLTVQNIGGGQWSLTLAGATAGDTTVTGALTAATGQMNIGTNTSNVNGFFGRISRYIEAL